MSTNASSKFLIPVVVIAFTVAAYMIFSPSTTESDALDMGVTKVEKTAGSKAESTNDESENKVSDIVEVNKVEQEVSSDVVSSTTDGEQQQTELSSAEVVKAEPEKVTLVEGKDNDYITKFPMEEPKEPVLVEFFSYWCPHCNNFEPTVRLWEAQKPESIKFVKIPVVFGRESWKMAAKSYYIAEELELTHEFSELMFKTIHALKKPPQNEADIGKLFEQLGVSSKKFKATANSFNVDSKLRKAEYLAKKFQVSGVPYFLVNYKYEAATASYASEEALFRLWNNLPSKDFN